MSNKQAKKRARRKQLYPDLPDLAPIKRKSQPRSGGRFVKPDVDESVPTLRARCTRAGKKASEDNMREMRAQWHGCEAGRAMASAVTSDDERRRLWGAIQEMRRIQAAYRRSIDAPTGFAECLRIMLPVEPTETDADAPPIDTRDEVDKCRQAQGAWMRMQGWLMRMDRADAGICKRAVIDQLDERCPDPAALVRGLRFVANCIDGDTGRRR